MVLKVSHFAELHIGLGSTYRCIGEYDKAITVLETGLQQFPDNDVMKVFLSLAKYNVNDHESAMKLLLGNSRKSRRSERI